ncbi:MAG: bifunctional 2-keto-4-hydroxyglutarate aldolase/2-keto-3-deoxy-6-phosphogluconate aldolase [Tissierellia bacterium]|nr:bifunctional 2-keto-4-hydroxyglutarate aldolase/2-keto-3-deoxy-6-phosphogluconate aldolase [Tissierellia bacterium]
MQKFEVLKKITDSGVVAVVRASGKDEALKIAEAVKEGGVNAIEVTFTVPGADEVIKALVDKYGDELMVGAGTVLDSETARAAILVGAKYIVSPAFNKETAKLCNRYNIPYMPGCFTMTEVVTAMEYGASIIKIFPGSAVGPSYIKALKGPLPQADIMPTGGVSLDNVSEWIKYGCVAVGVGGNLTKGTPEEMTNTAREFVKRVKQARN